MDRAAARALIERLHALWSGGDLGSIPEIYAPDFVAHMPKGWGSSEPRNGHDGIRRAIERLRTGFPDWCEHIDDMVIDGDKVAVRYHSTATHLGPFGTRPPTGRKLVVDELSICRIEKGRVAEQWCLNDDLAFDKQLDGRPPG